MKHILLAEDDKNTQFLITQKLKNEGYAVTVVEDGDQIIPALLANTIDLLVLDFEMPKKNGLEALQEIRKDSRFDSLPVIVVSNSGSPVEVYSFKQLGVKDYLIKVDFSPDDLMILVHKYV